MKKDRPYEIIHLDDAIVAVNKTSRLAVISGRGRRDNLQELLAADPALHGAKPLLVHRIDADTSGVMVFALTPEAQRNLAEQFRTRTVVKEYLALVRGTPLNESGSVDLPIGRDPHDKNRMVIRGLEAKKARTKWVVEERFGERAGRPREDGGPSESKGSRGGAGGRGGLGGAGGAGGASGAGGGVTLLRVIPVTGRRHQIRVHLKAIGYPLAVDPYYGGDALYLSQFKRKYKLGKGQAERPLIDRLTLHAHRLTLKHPVSSIEITLMANVPKDFTSSLTALQKWAK